MPKQLGVAFACASHPHCAGRISAVNALQETHLIGVFDPDVEFARKAAHAGKVFGSAEELLAHDDIDLVIIEGTNSQNSKYAIQAATSGKAILIEKPGAENLERCEEVAHSFHGSTSVAHPFCQVGYHLRYSPSVTKALQIVADGTLGRITTARFHAAVMQPWLTNEWFCDTDDMGGMVFLDFCHMLDLLTLFLGEPTAHKSFITKLNKVPEHPFEDSAAFILRFGDVLAAGDCCGWEANDWISTWDIELYGTEGTLKVGIHPPWLKLYTPAEGWMNEEWRDFDGELNYHYEIADIANRIRENEPPGGCDIQQAVSLIRTIADMYASAKTP